MSWTTERISVNKRDYAVHHWTGQANAPVIIALHGFTGAGQDFEVLAGHPTNTYTWVCPDCLGHGDSHAPELMSAYSLENFIAMMDALFAKYGKQGNTFVLGYSQGGRLALHWAMRHGQKLAGLVLIGATAGIETPMERAERVDLDNKRAARIKRFGVEEFLREWMSSPLIATQSRLPEPWKSALLKRREKNSVAGLTGALTYWGAGVLPSLWDDLPKLACPVLIITGTEDTKFSGLAQRMARNFLRSRFVQVPEAGHAAHLEAPAKALSFINDFIKTTL
ncbi:MAG: 2-succinyl-6-hydroxy-2,4-cyclohexadiene-1-carboxylate synthase [Verrucomicrobiota bacterium]|nr:2-succinyl-6-hydroxy-2,4-cyclohexadiene-1-carboxylate synthase [Verrucomicrobiota bacterium]